MDTGADAAMGTEVDRHFARWANVRDPAALARVFDATAPKLLLLAMHLSRDVAAAEDLVQATFLVAMRAPERYDPARPVLPWLAGILAREAALARRRERRAPDPARLAASAMTAVDPAEAAAAHEALEQVARALDAMAEPYRQVLSLRLVHGLRAVQVARALGRSPETVRTQLRRGLALLRRELPRGLAVPALAALLSGAAAGRGLAALRAALLEAAGPSVPVTTSSATAVLPKLALLLSLLVVAGGAFLASSPLSRAIVPAAAPLAFAEARDAGSAVATDIVGVAAPAEPRTALAHVLAPAASPELAILRGRCVAAESGAPLAGCTVTLHGWPAHADRNGREAARVAWRDPPPAVTAADGSFAIAFAPPPSSRFEAEATQAGRVPVRSAATAFEAGAVRDVGDVRLHRGARVTGVVVDTDGAPVARVGLQVTLDPLPFGSARGDGASHHTATAGDGTFAFATPLLPGTWPLALTGAEPVAKTGVHVPVDLQPAPARIVVFARTAGAAITGVVVDGEGRPLARARLAAWPLGGGEPYRARSADDGTFRIECTGDATKRVRLTCAAAGEPVPIDDGVEADWGARDVRLVAEVPAQGRDVEVRVVAGDTGAPIEGFALRYGHDPNWRGPRRGPEFRLQFSGRHQGGRVVLSELRAEPHVLLVVPEGFDWAPSRLVRFAPQEHAKEALVVALSRRAPLRVRVVTKAGVPVAGTTVELLHRADGAPFQPAHPVMSLHDADDWMSTPLPTWRWDEGSSDAAGEVTLRAARDVDFVVRARGPGHVHHDREAVRVPRDGGVVVLAVDVGATLSGTLRPPDLFRRLRQSPRPPSQRPPGLRLVGDGGAVPMLERQIEVGDDGEFRFDGVPAGTWSVQLCWVAPAVRGLGAGAHSTTVHETLARVTLADGERRTLQLDAGHLTPARLRGTMRYDGTPFANGHFAFLVRGDGGAVYRIGGVTDGDGRYDLPAVLPGRYALELLIRHPATGEQTWAYDTQLLGVPPGDDTRRDFDLVHRVLRVRLRDAEGAPVRRTLVTIRFRVGNVTYDYSARTGEDGEATFEPAPPPGDVTFGCRPRQGDAIDLGSRPLGPEPEPRVDLQLR